MHAAAGRVRFFVNWFAFFMLFLEVLNLQIYTKLLKNATFFAILEYGDFSYKVLWFGKEPNWLRSDVSGNTDFAGLQCIDLQIFRH